MGDISENFNRSEFACRCLCGADTVDAELVELLEAVRAHFGAPITINCGHRCPTHNTDVGGAENSQHLSGRAADFKVRGHPASAVHEFLIDRYGGSFGIGGYSTFNHLDTRSGPEARW